MLVKRLLPLLLVLGLLLLTFASCGGGEEKNAKKKETGSSGETAGETAVETDRWANVKFGGETLKISISVNQDDECTFPAADIYTKGPDGDSQDTVQKMVLDRNRNAADVLELTPVYEETDLRWDEILPDIQQKVRLSSEDAPDIYNNDIYGLLRGMIEGDFCNVVVPELGEKSYFDFTNPCWHWDYMRGTSFRDDKIYLLAGDYFIDLIRMAWVMYVNIEIYDSTFDSSFGPIDFLYDDVISGLWDYDNLNARAEMAWRDAGKIGIVDENDDVIGFVACNCTPRIAIWTSGISIVKWDEDRVPALREQVPDLYEMARKYYDMYQTPGFIKTPGNLDATELFLKGNVLFVTSVLGEMESVQVRRVANLNKGLLPFPKYDVEKQDDYHTLVHDQAEIAAIMTTTAKFTEATAWLQWINEQSTVVLKEYYEKGLLLRYNDDPLNKRIIDLIHDKIDSPFEMILMHYVTSQANMSTLTLIQSDAEKQSDTFSSQYESYYPAVKEKFNEMVELFDNMK